MFTIGRWSRSNSIDLLSFHSITLALPGDEVLDPFLLSRRPVSSHGRGSVDQVSARPVGECNRMNRERA